MKHSEVRYNGRTIRTVEIDGELKYCGRDIVSIYALGAPGDTVSRWAKESGCGVKVALGSGPDAWVFGLTELWMLATVGKSGKIKRGVARFVETARRHFGQFQDLKAEPTPDPTPEPVEKQESPPEAVKPVDVDRVNLLMWIAREASGATKAKALAKLVEVV